MKVFKIFFIAILSLTFFGACEKSADESLLNEDLSQIQDDNGNLKANSRGQQTMPF